MSYRKITVDGVEYEYTVGKTFIKVRCFKEAIPKIEYAPSKPISVRCECCSEYTTVYEKLEDYAVTPKIIERIIRSLLPYS